MILRIEKVISTVPATLGADTVYFVRSGTGFDLYCSDSTGTAAHRVNGVKTFNGSSIPASGSLQVGFSGTVPFLIAEPGKYSTSLRTAGSGTLTTTTNTMYICPVALPEEIVLSSLGIRVSTAAASTAVRLVIYASDATNRPYGSPLWESAEILTTSTGVKSVSTNLTLKAGIIYWFCIRTSGAPVLTAASAANSVPIYSNGTSEILYRTATLTYSATTGAGQAPSTTTDVTTGAPIFYMQVGSINKGEVSLVQ